MTPNYLQPDNEICQMDASTLAERIRNGDLSAQEATEAAIHRIEAVDSTLNAVVIPLFDSARKTARALDKRQSQGEPLGKLHGVPVTIKEQFIVSGTESTLGVLKQVGEKYTREGALVRALREAGAIILGKTNIMQTLAGWESDNRVYGRTNNPWDLSRTPGGSSGGESAIIASGGSPLGLAGDLGGSTRIPAHFCGVHGLKPTSGRLTNEDFPPGLLSGGQETVIPQPGPIARSIDDLELAMQVFTGTSQRPTYDMVPPVHWPDMNRVRVEGLRIGFYTDSSYFPVSPALRRAVIEAAGKMEEHGATVVPFEPPDLAAGVRIFLGVLSAAGGIHYKKMLGAEKPIPAAAGTIQGLTTPKFILSILSNIMSAAGQAHLSYIMECLGSRSTAEYWKLVEERNALRLDFVNHLQTEGIDVLLCPPFALPAIHHGANADLFPAGAYANIYNVLGNPAGLVSTTRVRPGEEKERVPSKDKADITAKQVEVGSAGLPVGIQVVGRHWREDTVLAVMKTLEKDYQENLDYPLQTYVRANHRFRDRIPI